ncbi:hypothetical protein, partial [Acidiphilium angustum]|uniref:hypothetical protein n=1 Tax=Acidiphilium angustum TaxID=523 RepID=UPI001B806C60
QEMRIGRTDERRIPKEAWHPMPLFCSEVVRGFHLGQAVMAPRQQAGHMTALEPTPHPAKFTLNPKGRPHMLLF